MSAIALPVWATSQHRMDARSAQGVFISMQRRARVLAVERGEGMRFNVSLSGDSIWITSSTGTEESLSLLREFNADITELGGSDVGEHTICMSPRGFAQRACNSFSGSKVIVLSVGKHEESLRMLPLGQVEVL